MPLPVWSHIASQARCPSPFRASHLPSPDNETDHSLGCWGCCETCSLTFSFSVVYADPIPSLRLDALRISSVKKGRKAKEDFCTSCLYAALPYCSGASQAATMGKGGTKCAALHLPFFLSIGIYGCRVFRSPARFVGLSVQHRKGGHERSLSAAEMRMQMSEFQRTGAYK